MEALFGLVIAAVIVIGVAVYIAKKSSSSKKPGADQGGPGGHAH